MTTEIMDLCDKRREVRREKFTSLDYRANYQNVNGHVRKTMKEAKAEGIEN